MPIARPGVSLRPAPLTLRRGWSWGVVLSLGLLPGECALQSAEGVTQELVVAVKVEPARLSPGASAQAVLTVTNSGDRVARLVFPTSQRYDFLLLDLRGSEVWRWSFDKMFLQVITSDSLAPGATVLYQESFRVPPVAGRYQLVGSLLLMNGAISDTVAVNVAELR